MSKQYPATATAKDGSTIKEFTPYPTIRVATPLDQFKKSLGTSDLSSVADVAGANLVRSSRTTAGEWESELFDCLETLQNGTWTATALLAEIDRVGKAKRLKVTILPREYHPEVLDPTKGTVAVIEMFTNAQQQGREGLTGPGMMKDPSKSQAGTGDHALVYFDPTIWQPTSPIREAAMHADPAKYTGVGMDPQYVLFHELVHAMRSLKGLTDLTWTVTYDYWTREEFAANLITNIALSENNPFGDLRYGEVGFKRMPAQYKTSDGYLTSSEHTSLISVMCQMDPRFCGIVAASPQLNTFNPIRTFLRNRTR
jgi:hypothetical protein